MVQKTYHIAIIKNVDETLIHQWKKLWEKAKNANPYNSYEWFLTCLETKTTNTYEIYACYKDDELVAILPLEHYRCFGISVLGTLCKDYLLETSFLAENYDKELVYFFFTNLLKRKSLYFQKFDSELTTRLHELFPQFFISLISVNPTITFTNESPAVSSTSKQIKKIISKNTDQLRFDMHSINLEKYLETMFTLQESSAKKARSMDIFADEQTKTYYRNLTKNCRKFVRINILSFENVPIAYEYGFLYKNYYIGDQISYHNDYKRLSPGRIMSFLLQENLKKNNITKLNMGGGISSFKMSFTNTYDLLYNIYYSPTIFIMVWWKLINRIRRVKQLVSPKKNTRDHEFLFKTF